MGAAREIGIFKNMLTLSNETRIEPSGKFLDFSNDVSLMELVTEN